MLADLIQIVTTTTEKTDAQALAQRLHDLQLAACTQISGPIESSYRWNNRLEMSREWQLTIKTTRNLFAQVEALLLEHHPYDQPEIIAVPLLMVSPGYRDWALQQVADPAATAPEQSAANHPSAVSSSPSSPIPTSAPPEQGS
jgi:periplasmic divalent cation tolerance protein